MNPNQPTQTSYDYLNQIATKHQKKSFLRGLKPIHYIFGGIIIVALLIVIIGLIGNSITAGLKPPKQLAARLTATTSIVTNAQSKLKSTELRTLNSNLSIYLTNTNRDIVKPFAEINVNTAEPDDHIVKAESTTALAARLEDARLNGTFDKDYAREMAYQLENTLALMKKIYTSSGNNDVKTFLESAYTNLQPTQKSFADFDAANS
jgi:hypothetical protein